MEENTAEKKRESEQEKAKQREKATVRKLLPLSAPNRFNIEALTSEIAGAIPLRTSTGWKFLCGRES